MLSSGAESFFFQFAIQKYDLQNYNFASYFVWLWTWSLTWREEHRLGVFENRVLKKIFGPKKDDVSGELRRLHNEELNDLYTSPNIIKVMKS